MTDLMHSGVAHDQNPPGRGSGRYPYGSGENPGQHMFTFLSEVSKMRKEGIKDADIAKALLGHKGLDKNGNKKWYGVEHLKAEIAIAEKETTRINMLTAAKLYEECKGNKSEIARRMGVSEGAIRNWLNPLKASKVDKYTETAEMIKKRIEETESGIVDVSKATEYKLGCTENTKKVALVMLEKEGYVKGWVQIPQLGTNNKTTVMFIAKPLPGETSKETFSRVQKNKFDIKGIEDYTPDNGKTWWTPQFPESLSSDRIKIRYAEEGGKEKDGTIEINPKAIDLSLEGATYAQVRIAVDGKYYMKGMAFNASDKLPKGVDVIYNTNKPKGTPKEKVFKEMKILKNPDGTPMLDDNGNEIVDPKNPFGALIKTPKDKDGVISRGGQHYYIDKDGNKKLSPINKLRDEGDWDSWSRNLSSQFLSKQPIKLIKQQIDLSVTGKKADLDDIMKLTNPVIKKKLLEEYASSCDANASDLSVKGFKNQAFQVLIPIPDLKDTEVYAPGYKDGDTVALVRYPHGGIFEIPILKVNNKHETAVKVLGKNPSDCIGINSAIAEILSGADFDGDTALVVPVASNKISIQNSKPLEKLKGFDGKELYKLPEDAPTIKHKNMQNEMGRITNLITDMTIQGANAEEEIARAVRHSMVVIDSEKHRLDIERSAKDNKIQDLKDKYQKQISEKTGRAVYPAATIFSRSKSEVDIEKRKEITDVKKMTPDELKRWESGKKVYRNAEERIVRKITDPSKMTPDELAIYNSGRGVYRTTDEYRKEKVHRMDLVDDAMDLVRDPDNEKEVAYAKYANSLKSLANQARKEARSIKPISVSKEASKTYADEVASLKRKLIIAESNKPREREAQAIANSILQQRLDSNPDMDYEHRKREEARCLNEGRSIVGAKKELVVITDKEWEAIQANAVNSTTLKRILDNTDQEAFKKRATPRETITTLSEAKLAKLNSMINSGMYTQKEIADSLGVSASYVSSIIRDNKQS